MRAIDADALIDNMEKQMSIYSAFSFDKFAEGCRAATALAIAKAKEASTIDPVKRAKWVQPDDGPIGCLVCSNCRTYPISKNGRWHLTKYCPDCGAKMEE